MFLQAAFIFAPYMYLPAESFLERETIEYKKRSVMSFCYGLVMCWLGLILYLIRDVLI